MARQYLNLADVYGAADQSRANQMQLENQRLQQQRYQMEMQQAQRAQQEQDAIRGIYRGATEMGADGVPVLNEKKTISGLYGVAPEQALKLQESFRSRDADAEKSKRENSKAALEQRVANVNYIKSRLPNVTDENSYQALLQEANEIGATGFTQSAPPNYDPNWQRSQMMDIDKFLAESTPKYERVDLGGKIQVVDVNPVTNPKFAGMVLNKTATIGEQESQRHNRVTEGISGAQLGVSRDRLSMDRDKVNSPPKTALSAAAQKELFEADEMAQASKNALGMLAEAKKLNSTAYSGFGAKPRAIVASNLGLGGQGADDTVNLDNLMTGQALESLKATFGGMPTEGERKILLDIQASADKTPTQRAAILDRAESAAKRRISFNENKAKALREGTYFTEGAAQPSLEQPTTPQAATNKPAAPKEGAISKSKSGRNMVYIKGQWEYR